MSSFSSISTALTALQAHRRALDVTGHNIANVNTPGYTRQRVDLQPRESPGAGSVMSGSRAAGAGVEIVGTSRLADEFLTARVRSQTSNNAELQARAETLTEIERLLSEPGEQGLSKKLSEMWSAWSTVANTADPDATAAKTVLLNKTQAVIDAVKSGQREVGVLWNDQSAQASGHVTEINGLSAQIAELNRSVINTAPDGTANELIDQRDQLITRMVELTGATVVPADRGQVNVYIGGSPAVSGIDSYTVRLAGATSMAGTSSDPVRLVWSDTTRGDVGRAGGQLAGELAALNTVLPAAGAKYDQLALSMTTTINAAYAAAGATPATFLTATSAVDLRLTSTDPKLVATGAPGAGPKDGSVAAAIAELRNAGGGPDELWRAHVVGTGVQVQASSARADVAAATLGNAVSDQQSAVGVSLDEETANLLMIQRAYEGAARVLTAVDQALDTLINRTGLVGR